MARYIDAEEFLDLFYVAAFKQDKLFVKTVEMVVDDTPTADVVEIELLKDWLWEIAINNAGEDFSIACKDIISRLDGLRSCAKERAVNYESSKTEKR